MSAELNVVEIQFQRLRDLIGPCECPGLPCTCSKLSVQLAINVVWASVARNGLGIRPLNGNMQVQVLPLA